MILASIVPFFVLVAYRFSSHLHYSKFIIFSSSTFIIITNPYKKKQTAISNMFYLLFSKERWNWLWLRIILQGIKTEFVFFFRNFYSSLGISTWNLTIFCMSQESLTCNLKRMSLAIHYWIHFFQKMYENYFQNKY